ncbi:hypothetical protein B5G50_27940 [Brevibacillus brevis]|uniref:hypothetical protein n=1 Tax=Brevibacillus brevis TaxID=1393 RepID=UPI000B36DA7A|nr:hypothetical protein [Brevibacillus brevis]OUQ85223.1 hypothetical protein B5G50_27940 [Brevibacillus brevis]
MSSLSNKKVTVPPSIELLFDNERLDLMKTLCLLYACSLKSKTKFRKVSEIVFYYSLVNFDMIILFDTGKEKKISPNLYFRFQLKINQILLKLSHLKFIDIKGKLSDKTEDIAARLTPTGSEFFGGINSEFFSKLTEEYTYALNKVECTASNMKVLKGGS